MGGGWAGGWLRHQKKRKQSLILEGDFGPPSLHEVVELPPELLVLDIGHRPKGWMEANDYADSTSNRGTKSEPPETVPSRLACLV